MAGKAWPIAGFATVSVVVLAAWVSWLSNGHTVADSADSYLLTNSAMAVTFTAFGTFVLAHRPRHRIGRLFVIFGGC